MSAGDRLRDEITSRWLWPFELLEKVGQGGMGVVYRARYVKNDRIVAVKLLPEYAGQDPILIARFEREMEILRQLDHPNIVHCFGGVCAGQQRYYAMEWVEGGTLADLLREKKRLSWAYVLELGLQMCAALAHAHRLGIVHRDLKPSNFLLSAQKQIKLADFGLAWVANSARVTRVGKTAGTFEYMAPEQIRGHPPVSPQTDLYALGCVWFELLTGHPPFGGDTPAVLLRKHLKHPAPSVLIEVPDCPPALDRLIQDLLQKNPLDRPQSAEEVARRLELILRPSLQDYESIVRTSRLQLPARSNSSSRVEESSSDSLQVHKPRRMRQAIAWAVVVVLLSVVIERWWWQAQQTSAWQQACLRLLMDENPHHRRAAVELLNGITTSSAILREKAINLLQDQDSSVRLAAIRYFQQHPEQACGALTVLIRIQKLDEEPIHREAAGAAVSAIRMYRPRSPVGGIGRWIIFGLILMGGAGWYLSTRFRWNKQLGRLESAERR